jgi:hypothetical protein
VVGGYQKQEQAPDGYQGVSLGLYPWLSKQQRTGLLVCNNHGLQNWENCRTAGSFQNSASSFSSETGSSLILSFS